MKKLQILLGTLAALGLAALNPAPAAAQAPAKITIVVFGFPSLGAFMPPVIKAKKLDEANGLDIDLRGTAADRLHHPVQLRRIQGRRQRRAAHRRLGRRARREGEVSVQPVRFLGRRRHLAPRG